MLIYNQDKTEILENIDNSKGLLVVDGCDENGYDTFIYIPYTEEELSNIYRDSLRRRRVEECFAICDRACWYDTLTAEQKEQVKTWRQSWLDVTDTKVIPQKPSFI